MPARRTISRALKNAIAPRLWPAAAPLIHPMPTAAPTTHARYSPASGSHRERALGPARQVGVDTLWSLQVVAVGEELHAAPVQRERRLALPRGGRLAAL
eukprot:CAMPEP_0118824628 /NCGR_PEP_ID=MMETSP1162-20130426/10748_1 /TAXON_ID=33656 /ORGANISM="Phaeocystis Sp, Strain CCMP2710" /LENGTH=98 /DNA_ID=CAMNT_0006755269 /DNA_START=152 /DNA_END=445 /DNA_ORIENTATION=+